jgi:sulfur-carrier protein
MIRIEVRLYAGLERAAREAAPGQPLVLEVADGTAVRGAVEALGLPIQGIHLVFVNGQPRGLDHRLEDEDRLGLFPPVGGG